jgi:hypothetical protein
MEPSGVALNEIPQGVDDLVPLDDVLAVRCGPHWFKVDLDLSGGPRALSKSEQLRAEDCSVQLPLGSTLDTANHRELVIPDRSGSHLTVTHPLVVRWEGFGTWSPDRSRIAVAGSTVERQVPSGTFVEAIERPYVPWPSVLALIDVATGEVTICDGTFDNFCYPPAWTADGGHLAFGAPFEPKRIYTVDIANPILNVVKFKRHVPMPLLDVAFLQRT